MARIIGIMHRCPTLLNVVDMVFIYLKIIDFSRTIIKFFTEYLLN